MEGIGINEALSANARVLAHGSPGHLVRVA